MSATLIQQRVGGSLWVKVGVSKFYGVPFGVDP